jgi:uncharacterized protein YijF (DUF1287 family)
MKTLLLLTICALLYSCSTLKVAPDKNLGNIKAIGIETFYGTKADNIYTDHVKASIDKIMNVFNSENHGFQVHKKIRTDRAYLTLDFSKVKIVKNSGVAAGFIVTAIGLIATPILVLEATEQTAIAAFWYLPVNKIECTGTLSSYLNSGNASSQRLLIQTGAMFRRKDKRISVTVNKFENAFYNILLDLEKQLKSH